MRYRIPFLTFLAAFVFSCAQAPQPSTEESVLIGADITKQIFDAEHIYFGSENRRSVDKEIAFPSGEYSYQKIIMTFSLSCPALQRCDAWDRKGWLAIVENAGSEDNEQVIELWRFITPYGVGANWEYDVTDLRPFFKENVTFRIFIDTWVGPGHAAGDGWIVDVDLEFIGGIPNKRPVAVIPVWTSRSFEYGNPASSTSPAATASIPIPASITAATVRTLVTGHGQGNAENCAEFCEKEHTLTVGSKDFSTILWRDDCAETAVPDQLGNWRYPRAGWCPGAYVIPWIEDVTTQLTPGGNLNINYSVEEYENTCRPDAETCTGCVFGTSCEYNSTNHTQPNYVLSSLITLYE